jgi:hypothetical protein
LSSISVFGVSPFGDEYLLNKLNSIKEVTIYIYDKKNNLAEQQAWREKVPHAILIDSRKFGSE